MKVGLFLFPVWSVKLAPLGLAYVTAALRSKGHEVVVRDYNLEVYKKLYPGKMAEDGYWFELGNRRMEYTGEVVEKMIKLLSPFVKDIAKEMAQEKYDVIGISLFSSSMKFTELVLKIFKLISPKTKIIIGGPSSSRVDADFFLKHKLCDYVVYGEGEKIMCDLLDRIKNNLSHEDLPSIKYLDNENNIITNKRTTPMSPEEFYLPDFSDLVVTDYTYEALPIMMSRGCVAACSFCNETHYWHRYRMAAIEKIGNELMSGIKDHNPKFVYICDSLINGDHELLNLLVDFVIAQKTTMSWGGNARFDMRLTYEILEKMKRAGCDFVTFGLESGSNKVLKKMGKRVTMDVVRHVLNDCERAGLGVNVNILIGFPGEEEEDFQETVDFLLAHKHQINLINTGTEMEIAENSGVYRRPSSYNILVDEHGEIVKYKGGWTTADYTNTLEIRKDRLRRLRLILRRENMMFHPEAMMHCSEENL